MESWDCKSTFRVSFEKWSSLTHCSWYSRLCLFENQELAFLELCISCDYQNLWQPKAYSAASHIFQNRHFPSSLNWVWLFSHTLQVKTNGTLTWTVFLTNIDLPASVFILKASMLWFRCWISFLPWAVWLLQPVFIHSLPIRPASVRPKDCSTPLNPNTPSVLVLAWP